MFKNFLKKNSILFSIFICLSITALWSSYIAFSSHKQTGKQLPTPRIVDATQNTQRPSSTAPTHAESPKKQIAGTMVITASTTAASPPPIPPTTSAEIYGDIPVTLTIDGTIYAKNVVENSTVQALMEQLRIEHPTFTFSGKEYGALGYFVESINGLSNNTKTQFYWTLYVNGTRSNLGVSNYTIRPFDSIMWKYEKD